MAVPRACSRSAPPGRGRRAGSRCGRRPARGRPPPPRRPPPRRGGPPARGRDRARRAARRAPGRWLYPDRDGQGRLDRAARQLVPKGHGGRRPHLQQPDALGSLERVEVADDRAGQRQLDPDGTTESCSSAARSAGSRRSTRASTASTIVAGTASIGAPDPAAATISVTKKGLPAREPEERRRGDGGAAGQPGHRRRERRAGASRWTAGPPSAPSTRCSDGPTSSSR